MPEFLRSPVLSSPLILICQIFLDLILYDDLNWVLFKVSWMELREAPIAKLVDLVDGY